MVDGAHSQNKTFSANQMLATDSLNNFYIALFDKLSKVELCIILLGSCELAKEENAPNKIINSYINIAKKYGGKDSYSLVNGVLDNVRQSISISNSK